MPKPALTYLTRRGSVFWFRMAVPKDLIGRVGCREIKGSLRTRSPTIARLRCQRLGSAILQLIARVRSMPEVSQETIKRLSRRYFEQLLSSTEELAYLIPTDPAVDQAYEAQDSLDEAERLKTSLAERRYDAITKGAAVEMLSTEHVTREALPFEDFDQLCEAIARARIEAHRIYAAKLRGRYDEIAPRDPLFAGMMSTAMPALPGTPKGLSNRSVASLIKKFLDLKRPSWAAKTSLDNKTILDLFAEVVGVTTPIESIGKHELRNFRDVLLRLPKNYTKRKAASGQDVLAIIKSSKEPIIQKPTITKYLTRTYAFLDWCADEGYLTSRLPRVKGPSVSSVEAHDARYPFSEKQLRTIFTSPLYMGCKSASRRSKKGQQVIRDGKFWIPLIALYSGMRLGEIVQLLVGDIKSEDGVAYFDISRGEGEKKQIKTASSKRRVPIHKMLIALGLLDYVAAAQASRPKERLFEEIKPGANGDFSHNFSKWFGRYVRDIGAKTPKTAFHSFRHNFKDALVAAGVPESHARTLMGHADDGVHGLYGTVVAIKLLNTELQKIHYPLELSNLMAAGGPH
jgi:integrase